MRGNEGEGRKIQRLESPSEWSDHGADLSRMEERGRQS